MSRTGSVAAFASHVDLEPGCVERVGIGAIVFVEVGRVTLRAHEIPVLLPARPVQRIGGVDFIVGVDMKPALPTLLDRTHIPGKWQRLDLAAGKLNHVLLQWLNAEGIGNGEFPEFTVRIIGLDKMLPVAHVKRTSPAEILEFDTRKVTEHRFNCRVLHRQCMVRTLPCVEFSPVATAA